MAPSTDGTAFLPFSFATIIGSAGADVNDIHYTWALGVLSSILFSSGGRNVCKRLGPHPAKTSDRRCAFYLFLFAGLLLVATAVPSQPTPFHVSPPIVPSRRVAVKPPPAMSGESTAAGTNVTAEGISRYPPEVQELLSRMRCSTDGIWPQVRWAGEGRMGGVQILCLYLCVCQVMVRLLEGLHALVSHRFEVEKHHTRPQTGLSLSLPFSAWIHLPAGVEASADESGGDGLVRSA